MSGPPNFKTAGEMPSGPGIEDVEIREICLLMELSVNGTLPRVWQVEGGRKSGAVVILEKTEEKYSLNALQISLSELIIEPLILKDSGIYELLGQRFLNSENS